MPTAAQFREASSTAQQVLEALRGVDGTVSDVTINSGMIQGPVPDLVNAALDGVGCDLRWLLARLDDLVRECDRRANACDAYDRRLRAWMQQDDHSDATRPQPDHGWIVASVR